MEQYGDYEKSGYLRQLFIMGFLPLIPVVTLTLVEHAAVNWFGAERCLWQM